jgi:glycosyltransferase involved in cell wall biosynthesis
MSIDRSTVSVVITCFSEGELIFEAVNSVKSQSILPLEIIIVNDASQDQATNKVCQQLEQEPNIKIIWRSQNGGPSAARNDGFQAAQGEILVLLDADDLLPQNALSSIQNVFAQSPSLGFIYGSYLREDNAGHCKIVNPGDISLKTMLRSKPFRVTSQWVLIGTTPLKRSLWQNIHGYNTDFEVQDLHDVEFWMRVLSTGCDYQYIPDCIYHWRKYLGNNSRKVTPEAWYKIAKLHMQIYKHTGLEYRAYELLLLGSKWLKYEDEIKQYSRIILNFIAKKKFKFSTFIVLLLPVWLLQIIAEKMQKSR